uniref:Small ribosomal subunit protein uS15m n=1 Tax=Pogona vitticeps TaxID=103695 RepID=A0ABM5ET57_9SAUR
MAARGRSPGGGFPLARAGRARGHRVLQDGGAQAVIRESGGGAMAAWLRGAWALGGAVTGRGGCLRGAPGVSPFLQACRGYARPARKKKMALPSHLDDLPPTMLRKDYANLPIMDKVDDVVKRLLSLEMSRQKEKLKIKKEQLADKVRQSPNDNGSLEVQVAYLTAKIRTSQEHMHMHPKDKATYRCLLMAIDRRKQLLGYLRRSRYDVFEKTCKELDIEYVLPVQYRQRRSRRYLIKRELRQKILKELRKKELENQESEAKQEEQLNEGTSV